MTRSPLPTRTAVCHPTLRLVIATTAWQPRVPSEARWVPDGLLLFVEEEEKHGGLACVYRDSRACLAAVVVIAEAIPAPEALNNSRSPINN